MEVIQLQPTVGTYLIVHMKRKKLQKWLISPKHMGTGVVHSLLFHLRAPKHEQSHVSVKSHKIRAAVFMLKTYRLLALKHGYKNFTKVSNEDSLLALN